MTAPSTYRSSVAAHDFARPAYLSGFQTLAAEISLPALPVQGSIPEWLTDTLLRVGPGRYEWGPVRYRRRSLIACMVALFASMSASYAGPCSEEIARFRAEIEAKQQVNAATGPTAPEGTAATMHRQPTPESIGAAESRLGEVSPEKLQAVWGAVERASEADHAGDQIACEAALADARRAFSQ